MGIWVTEGWRFWKCSHNTRISAKGSEITLVTWKCCSNSESERLAREGLTPVDRCLKRPPKIYDPLYFNDDGGWLNPFLCMDRFYTHEANAYMALNEIQVHMILIEHIQGLSMADASPAYYPQSLRQQIMKSIVDIDSRISEKDILLTDVEPRNVIVFVDLGHALFNRSRDYPRLKRLNNFLGHYISPLLRWNNVTRRNTVFPFSEWIDWDWDPWLEVEFAHTVQSITPEMRKRWPTEW
ncbi:uncharacterized protein BDV14DRAFT_189453 [Aspergillus stella-maris]|uniref:uncharacterized protein n=1 Tax=Aspergillus stella-maris TaxID=1810926 RepID=UPI003CCE524F